MNRLVGLTYEAIILEAIREPLLDMVAEHEFVGISFTTDGVILKTRGQDYVLELRKENAA